MRIKISIREETFNCKKNNYLKIEEKHVSIAYIKLLITIVDENRFDSQPNGRTKNKHLSVEWVMEYILRMRSFVDDIAVETFFKLKFNERLTCLVTCFRSHFYGPKLMSHLRDLTVHKQRKKNGKNSRNE